MPQIIVQAGSGDRTGAVTLQERVSGNDLNSDHFARQLVERICWALLDAEDLEDTAEHVGRRHGESVLSTGAASDRYPWAESDQ